MVPCKQCSTPNSIDSLFCKQCGTEIAGDERSDAQHKLEDLVSEGYKIFNEGRTAEAKLIAETALADDPTSTSALSLKGMCHERAGELALALEAFEKVVERNPDSALDKIKVTHLRQSITGKSLAEPPPRKAMALLGAAAAVVLVVAIGVAMATSGPSEPKVVSQSGEAKAPNLDTETFTSKDLNSSAPQTQPGTVSPNVPKPDTGGGPVSPGASHSTGPVWGGQGLRNGSRNNGFLPNPIEGTIGPATIDPSKLGVRPENPPKSGGDGGDVEPTIDRGNSGTGAAQADPPIKPANDPGYIDIHVSKPRQTLGGAASVPDGNGVEALLKTASQQFLIGHFAQAASSYEAALRGGASGGSTNQRLAQCYSNLGRSADAANAYRRAISSYEASISGGSDSPRLKSALESCKQALKVLGG